MMVGSAPYELAMSNWWNDKYKHKSMHHRAPPEEFLKACKEEWDGYCKHFEALGDTCPRPPYPYTQDDLNDMLEMEFEQRAEDEEKNSKKMEHVAFAMRKGWEDDKGKPEQTQL